jgi:type II secretory pathway pseudopilin PulG
MRRILAAWWVVLAVSLAAAILIPATGNIVDLKITRARQDFGHLDTALELFRHEHGRYPTEAEGIAALVPDALLRVPIDP